MSSGSMEPKAVVTFSGTLVFKDKDGNVVGTSDFKSQVPLDQLPPPSQENKE
jgi:hypothetical protein